MLGDLEQVAGGAGQAVETLDHDDVALAYLLEQAVQLRPVASGAGDLLLMDAPATALLQRQALQGKALVVAADSGVADEHAASSRMSSRKDCLPRLTLATGESPGSAVPGELPRNLGITRQELLREVTIRQRLPSHGNSAPGPRSTASCAGSSAWPRRHGPALTSLVPYRRKNRTRVSKALSGDKNQRHPCKPLPLPFAR